MLKKRRFGGISSLRFATTTNQNNNNLETHSNNSTNNISNNNNNNIIDPCNHGSADPISAGTTPPLPAAAAVAAAAVRRSNAPPLQKSFSAALRRDSKVIIENDFVHNVLSSFTATAITSKNKFVGKLQLSFLCYRLCRVSVDTLCSFNKTFFVCFFGLNFFQYRCGAVGQTTH